MTDYNRLSDAETAVLAFWGQDKWRKLRDNQDSHEERLLELLALDKQSIVDNFFSSSVGGDPAGVDASLYDVVGGGGTNFRTMMAASGDHVLRVNTAVADTKSIMVRQDRLTLSLSQEMKFTFEARCYDPGGTPCDNILIGYSDNGTPSDESDCIAFLKGTTAGKWRFRVAKGNVPTEFNNVGNRATWQKLKAVVTKLGATFQVEAFIDGAALGAPITTNIPNSVVLRMVFAAATPGAGTTDLRMDRWAHRWSAIPENS
jgi:hypothetical protein